MFIENVSKFKMKIFLILTIQVLFSGNIALAYENINLPVAKNNINSTPAWLVKYVNRLNNEPVKDSPESIVEYSYNGNVVYYFSPPCCGKNGQVYDKKKNIICIIEKKKINKSCPDFNKTKKFKKLIWQENRD